MRKILFAALFAVVNAEACPDFSGEYSVCRTKQNVLIESTDMKVSQITSDAVTTYSFDTLPDGNLDRETTTLVTTGKAVKKSWISTTGERFESSTEAHCMGDALMVHATTTSDGRNWFTESSILRKVGNTLVKSSAGHVGEMSFIDTLTCY